AGSYTLPAREVRIEDNLDTALDWDTLEMGDIGIGTRTYQIGTWSHGTAYGTVSYNFDKTTGSITWYFIGEDSALPPIETGFLPPNETKPEGEGYVSYNIKAKGSATSGTIIKNKAVIRFDYNPSIETPEIYHILDLDAPTSTVTTAKVSTSTTFIVSWSGIDEVGSVSEYTVYVSVDNGTASVWDEMEGTSATSAYYTGEFGRTYGFYSVVKDKAGNVSTLSAPAMIQVLAPTGIQIDALGSKVMDIGGAVILQAKVLGTETLTMATWTICSGSGTLSIDKGTSTTFTATQIGTVTIKADDGTNTATIILMVGHKIGTDTTWAGTTTFSFGTVTIKSGTSAADIYILPPHAVTPINLSHNIGGIGIEINAYDSSGNRAATVSLYVEIGYNEGMLGNIDEETLRLWTSSDGSTWSEITPSGVDSIINIVYGTITHLSYLAPA
ncbi:MAG: hypothetical protein AAB296_01970, partial [Candidatus Desantisbacteria bacterium]